MRLEQAAFYLSMSQASFLRLVEDKTMPPPIKIRGMVLWDRLDVDDAFEELKRGQSAKSRNTIDELLGITDGEEG
jgi:predicted DNA-binding transcriptional regulator AlpA